MALTRDFKTTVKARVQRDPKFRKALLREAIESAIAGDLDTGKAVLRDYINATIGFPQLAAAVDIPPKASCACWHRRAIQPPVTFSRLSPSATARRRSPAGKIRRRLNPARGISHERRNESHIGEVNDFPFRSERVLRRSSTS